MDEPSMLVQRPSSSHCQETSHILFSTFRDVFDQYSISNDTVKNLSVSKRGENDFHDRYVENLQTIHEKWSKKIMAIERMINHLDKAKEQARNLERQEEAKARDEYHLYTELGLPSVPSRLDEFIDSDSLRENNLIVPKDFLRYDSERQTHRMSPENKTPQYRNPTVSSTHMSNKHPAEDNYYPEKGPVLPEGTKIFTEKKNPHKRLSQSTASASEKNVWRDYLTPKQREEEKKEILKLQTRANFLKNPRFAKKPKQLTKSDVKNEESITCFEIEPFPVIFTDYEVGRTYEMRIELRNVTASSRQVRLLQPTTPYYSLSHGEFPSENGLIAPGMSCYYTVQFSPTSLADYDDALQLKSLDDEPMLIPLQGRRQAPDLTLPRDLDCGYSLVGSCKTMEYLVENLGGPGRFCFSQQNEDASSISWDDMDFQHETVVVKLDSFTIQPACFKLNTNQTVVVKVSFQPNQVKSFSASVRLLCDNCCSDSYNLSGSGEVAEIALRHVEGGTSVPVLGETFDQSAERMVVFTEAYPGVVYKKEVEIQNRVSVPLRFQWQICFPSAAKSSAENESESESVNESDAPNTESVFRIEPSEGYLREQDVTTFNVLFMPSHVNNWFDVARLVLKDIPTLKDNIFEEDDQNHLKLSLKGSSQCFSLALEPPVIIMSGKFYAGIEYFRTVKTGVASCSDNAVIRPNAEGADKTIHNNSTEDTTFRWEILSDEHCSISIQPEDGVVGAESCVDFLITIIGKKSGQVNVRIPYHTPHVDEARSLHLQCQFVGPKITFQENDISFGLVRLGTEVEGEITLINENPVDAPWTLSVNEQDASDCVGFAATNGVLPPYTQQAVCMRFCPNQEMTFHGFLQCTVEGGKTSYLPLFGEVQRPNVYIKESSFTIDRVFLNVPVKKTITFCNTTLLDSALQYVECLCENCEVVVNDSSTTLGPLEKKELEVLFVFRELGKINSAVVFHVDEMLEPIAFEFYADVKGLIIDIAVPNMQDLENKSDIIRNNDVLEFGDHVVLGQPTEALVVIENQSAIDTSFEFSFKEFPCARVPTPPTIGSPVKGLRGKSSSSRPLLKKTSNIGDPKSRTEEQARKEYAASLLRGGKGLGLMCTPSCGGLAAFERKVIIVTVYSDMWGRYNDILVCRVGEDQFEQLIPVACDVIGSPLNFQIAKDQAPFVRFGPHPSAGSMVTRNMRINNSSYVDIRLDWETFVIDPSDEQLIDLSCYFGNPFPLLDQNGVEVVDDEDYGQTDQEQESLIKIILSEHQGQKSTLPFNIINKQMIVPAQSWSSIEVTFTPPVDVKEERNYLGYALGHMTLKHKDREDGQRLQRADGLDMLPFGLNMTGCVKPTKLCLEACDEEEYTFELSATDLLDESNISNFQLKENISSSHRYVISNNCGTAVSFTCHVQPPFHFVSTNGKYSTSDRYTLKPSKNIEIRVAFLLTRDLVTSDHQGDILTIEKNMELHFDNNIQKQTYPLTGIVNYPFIQASNHVIEFGTCLVGEKREVNLHISNHSKSVLYWSIVKDESCPLATRNVFTVSHQHGKIASTSEENVEHSTDVRVGFLAKHNVKYECIIILYSDFHKKFLGEAGQSIVLRGAGSYDEASKEKVV